MSLPDVMSRVKNRVKDTLDEAGKGAEDIGQGLAEKQKNIDAAFGHTNTEAPVKNLPATQPKGLGRYGDRPGEKRIDTDEMTRPLGSYKKGTDSVPKTGVYKVHEGEKVVPAKDNTMSEHSPAEKAHFHRAMSHLHTGALHRHFGIAEGEPIPMEKKQEAANSDNPHVAAMGRMAVAMHGWKHGKK